MGVLGRARERLRAADVVPSPNIWHWPEVYEVENPHLGSRHALKLFTYEKDDPEVRERFQTEGRLLAAAKPEGAGIVAAVSGEDPFAATTVVRRHWS